MFSKFWLNVILITKSTRCNNFNCKANSRTPKSEAGFFSDILSNVDLITKPIFWTKLPLRSYQQNIIIGSQHFLITLVKCGLDHQIDLLQ
jgi:hypothetical protein